MDGNGRWAEARGLPRIAGHRRGADAVKRTVEAAANCGIDVLTLYAFSSDNWKRPPAEVSALMGLFCEFLDREAATCARESIRLSVIGRRDRLDPRVAAAVGRAEHTTQSGRRLHLRIAVDYSSRDALLAAARACADDGAWSRDAFSRALDSPDVDLLIRTSGEQRISDFLLWECAYAEFVFLSCLWPDFSAEHLADAVRIYRSRDRRFGRVPAAS